MSLLRRTIARIGGRPGRAEAASRGIHGVSVETPPALYVVGDVHGHFDLYRTLEQHIAAECATMADNPALLVLVGDVIDRGPDSAAMVDHLLSPAQPGIQRICVMGNHEEMALDFLTAPEPRPNAPWLAYGGEDCLASYGISLAAFSAEGAPSLKLRQTIEAHVPHRHIEFLRTLPHFVRAGAHFVAHAGASPDRPLDRQRRADLIWTRHSIATDARPPEGLGSGYVIHGHVPVERPEHSGWRINVDTGAYASGRLSGVRLIPGEAPAFLSVDATGRIEGFDGSG